MEYVHNLIWLCPMLFVAGFIDSIAGGGGLIAMPAYMMCGMPMYYVYGCNKFQCAFGSTAAAMRLRRFFSSAERIFCERKTFDEKGTSTTLRPASEMSAVRRGPLVEMASLATCTMICCPTWR